MVWTMKKTEEKAVTVECGRDVQLSTLNGDLTNGWKVKQMCAYNQSSALYAKIVIILEREINT
jgi:hypothetical protein